MSESERERDSVGNTEKAASQDTLSSHLLLAFSQPRFARKLHSTISLQAGLHDWSNYVDNFPPVSERDDREKLHSSQGA